MKKAIRTLAIIITISLFTVACGSNSKPETHTHEDGTVHESHNDHCNDAKETPQQESFAVDADSLATTTETTHEHHAHDHSHDHKH